jgi:hypothetical protein
MGTPAAAASYALPAAALCGHGCMGALSRLGLLHLQLPISLPAFQLLLRLRLLLLVGTTQLHARWRAIGAVLKVVLICRCNRASAMAGTRTGLLVQLGSPTRRWALGLRCWR